MKNSSCQPAQELRSQEIPYGNTHFSETERLRAFFEKLESGEHPDFLAVMTAISDCVAITSDCDLFQEDHCDRLEKMSGKKCRFCG